MDTTAQIVYGNGLSDGTFLLVGFIGIMLFVMVAILFIGGGSYTGSYGSGSGSEPGGSSGGSSGDDRPYRMTDYERSIDYNDPKYDPPHHVF